MDENKVRSKMQKVLEMMISDIGSIRTGRATPSIVEDIDIPAYGGQQVLKLQELATINVEDPQTIVIEPWDKSIVGDIKKGIMAANVGLNPNIDGEIIRINLPPMTTEDREKYIKLLNTKLENGKVMIRQIRTETKQEIEEAFENKELSEDAKFAQEKKLQTITDEFVDKIEEVGRKKEQELKQV